MQERPEAVNLAPGLRLTGYRLLPGARVAQDFLSELLENPHMPEAEITNATSADTRAADAIAALSDAVTVLSAAKACGVSERSLHRILVKETGRSPVFWHRLARVRRAALDLNLPLADLAFAQGFSDQAHMTREFQRWFGVSPHAMRAANDLRAQLRHPALATGEQISTRKPLMSDT